MDTLARRRPPIVAAIVLGVVSVLASATNAAPIKDQGRVLIRVEGHEESLGSLSAPYQVVEDYSLSITTLGEGELSLFARQSGTEAESPDDPPRASVIRFRLAGADLAQLQRQVGDAHLGRQADCHSRVAFFALSSGALEPRQRLIWFGQGRRRSFAAWQGSECGAEVSALLRKLAGIARSAYALPTER